MMIAPLCLARPTPIHSAESRKRPKRPNCPRCGSRLLVAEHSGFNLAGRIDYVWPVTIAAPNLKLRSM